MRYTVFIIVFLFFAASCTSTKNETYDLVIQNGNIIDLETGSVLRQSVFITNARIVKVGNETQEASYEAKKTIDATGKYLLPGFWDNHIHFRGGDSLIQANRNLLNLFLANGITTVRDAGGDLSHAVLTWKEAIASGKQTGPTIFTAGPKIDGPKATWAGSLEVETEADIQRALDSLQNLSVDFVKLYDSRINGELFLKTLEETEERNLISSGHMPFTVTLNQTLDAGIDAIEHLYYIMKGCAANEAEITRQLQHKEIGFWEAMPALMAGYQDSVAQMTFARLREKDVFVVPTLHIGKTLSYLDEADHTNDDYLKYMGEAIIRTYAGRINRVKQSTDKAIADRKVLDAFFGKLTKALNEAGVPLLAGSDSGAYNAYTYPGISLHNELAELVNTGIPPIEALRSSAYNGARFLKQQADYGQIAHGKRADIVVLNTNPLEAIANTRDINTVIKDGEIYFRDALDKLLEASETD